MVRSSPWCLAPPLEAAVNPGAGRHGRGCRGALVAPHPRPGVARVQRARDRPQRRQLPLWSHPRRPRAARARRGRAAPDAQCDRRRYSTNWYRESRQRDELEREKKPIFKEGLSLSEIWLVTTIDFERDVDQFPANVEGENYENTWEGCSKLSFAELSNSSSSRTYSETISRLHCAQIRLQNRLNGD